MKKIYIAWFLVSLQIMILLTACSVRGENSDQNNVNSIICERGIYYNKNWGDSIGTYSGDIIPNEECAVEVAKTIFNFMTKSDEKCNFVPQSVFYDEEDEIWIVSFWKESDGITLGGDCSIALQKKDGKVLRIWFGE